MVINKKGQVLFYTLMLATLILVTILTLSKPTKEIINNTKTSMDCTNSSISEYDQASCYGYDIMLWFFICLGIALVFVVLGAKIVGG